MAGINEGELTSVAMCWRLERMDGAGIGLTSHDRFIACEGVSYSPTPGMMPASVTRQLGLEPHVSEVTGALSWEALDETDLALGRWDSAAARLTAVDWQDPNASPVQVIGGELGIVAVGGGSFSADLRGAATKLDQPICPATSAECRAEFGDKKCRIDLAGRTLRVTIVGVDGNELTLDQALDDRFVLGRLRYLNGINCGLTTTILAVDGALLQVRELPRATIASGCQVELRQGCDKRFQTCVERFANAVNFRAEPHLPGTDLLTRYPGI